jgi:hypothetical protein
MKYSARAVCGLFIIVLVPEVLPPLNAGKLTLEDCVLILGRIAKKEKDGGQMSAQDTKRLNKCNIAINPSEWSGKERLRILKVISENPKIFGELRK